ncbi:hypothetical protein NDA16_001558 [Ustilago loliicola]|nr:hypothetical protein NDA16_001558 [Ustilago loliicola]
MSSSSTSITEVDPSTPRHPHPPLYNASTLGKVRQLTGVAALCCAMLLTQSALGQTVVPIRDIARTFDVLSSDAQQSWFAASFSLTVGTFVLPAGRVGDIVGHKSIVVLGYLILSIFSLLAGLSHYTGSYIFFDVCRAMQGIGCAVLLPNSLAILGRVFAPGTYAKHLSFSFFAATAPNGFLVGALFTTLMSMNRRMGWWWGFYVMAITAALLAGLCFWVLPSEEEMKAVSASWNLESKEQQDQVAAASEAASVGGKKDALWKRLDLFGTITGVVGLILFNFSFNQALVVGWETVYVYVLLIVGVIFIAIFIYGEGKALYPLLPTSVFHLSGTLILLSLAFGWASFGIWVFYLNLFNQNIRQFTPIFNLLTFVPAGVAGIVAAFSSAQILGRTSPPFVMLLSLLAFCIGICIAGNAPVRTEALPYIIFIPLYLLLGLANLLNVIKHGFARTSGFISLLLFSLCHLTGNIILVYEYLKHYPSITTTVWGYILQSIGLSFLVSAALAFLSRAKTSLLTDPDQQTRIARRTKLLNLVNIGALICVITGYTSVDFTNSQGQVINPNLPIQTKIGAILYIALILVILVLTLGLRGAETQTEAKAIRMFMLVSSALMVVRSGYGVYTTFTGGVLMPKNIWVRLVLQYISEFGALAAMTSLGFMMGKLREVRDYDMEEASTGSGTPLKSWQGRPSQMVQMPVIAATAPPTNVR